MLEGREGGRLAGEGMVQRAEDLGQSRVSGVEQKVKFIMQMV